MPDTFTPNYNLTKPEVGGSRDAWGNKWNENLDILDAALKSLQDDYTAKIAALETIPPGTIAYFAQMAVPTGWLRCNGATLVRATYPKLFAAIQGLYGFPDANTFNIPDIRGVFIRGLDEGRGYDPNRGPGPNVQGSQNLAHSHPPTNSQVYITGYGAGIGGGNVGTGPYLSIDYSSVNGGAEARPVNLAFPACIKY